MFVLSRFSVKGFFSVLTVFKAPPATVGHETCVSDLSKNRENREDHSLKQYFVFVMLHCDTIQLLVFLAFTVSAKGLILYFNPCQHPGIYIGQS